MPGQRTKFSEAWLSSTDSNGDKVGRWCQKGKDDYHGYCSFCLVDIKCDNGGKTQLLKHCANKKHMEAMKHCKDSKQTKLIFAASKAEASCSTSQPKPSSLLMRKELSETQMQEKAKLTKKKEALAKSYNDLHEQERLEREELKAADELLRDAQSKLNDALGAASVNKSSVAVAKMMLDTATTKRENAMERLDQIRKEQKSVENTTHKLLDEVLPSAEVAPKKRKAESGGEKKSKKKVKE